MSPDSKAKHLETLSGLIQAGQASLESIESARAQADSPMTSRYDTQRDIFNQDANVQREMVEKLTAFRDFIKGTKKERQVVLGAEVTLEFDDGDVIKNAIFAPQIVKLGEVTVITPHSPIGGAVQFLTAGERFSYAAGRAQVSGIVHDVK